VKAQPFNIGFNVYVSLVSFFPVGIVKTRIAAAAKMFG
jgi:hypothetical protein